MSCYGINRSVSEISGLDYLTRSKEVSTQAWETLQPALQNVGQKFMELYEAAKPILEIIALIAGVVGTFFVAQFVAGIQGMIAALTPLTNALSDLISFATNIINMFVALFTGDFTGACEFADQRCRIWKIFSKIVSMRF